MPAICQPVRGIRLLAAMVAIMMVSTGPSAEAAEPGVNGDLTWGISQGDVDRSLVLMQEAGVEWVRLNISWKSIEPNEKGSYSAGYLSNIDSVVDKVHAAGIKVLMPMADSVPYWASADPDKRIDSAGVKRWNIRWRPDTFDDYADAFRFVANRYSAKGVGVFEVWNEPNHSYFWPSGPSASAYARMLKAAYPAIKQAAPSATVLAGAVSQNDWRFVDGIYAAGGAGFFDAVSTHSYPSKGPAACWEDGTGHLDKNALCSVKELRRVMVARGDSGKDIWIDELGWSTCDDSAPACWDSGFTEAQQADHTLQAFIELEKYPWVKAALQYSFRNTYFRGDDPTDWNANLGLLRSDFSKKPAFAAFRSYTERTPGDVGAPPGEDAAPIVRLTAPTAGLVFDRSLALAAEASDDKAVAKVEFRLDGKLIGTDTSAPYELSYRVPKRLSTGSHQVQVAAYDAIGQSATDQVSVTRALKARLRFGFTAETLRVSLLPGELATVGRVRGVSSGKVATTLERYRRATDSWTQVAQSRVPVDARGQFAESLGGAVTVAGRWRVRARYLGTAQHPPSRTRIRRVP